MLIVIRLSNQFVGYYISVVKNSSIFTGQIHKFSFSNFTNTHCSFYNMPLAGLIT